MSFVETSALKNSTIMLLYSEKEKIQLDPDYQRSGGVWTKEKKQLLIDSILNDYDIPKIYFHKFSVGENKKFDFSVIDGRQRLETIWGFMDGDFSLADDFEYQRDPDINLSGLSYNDLASGYPRIRIKFDSFVLPIVAVETQDLDLIEDMFSRLNEAVPLNAAEKRNAIGGYLVESIRIIANLEFFVNKVSFGNRRAQHREVSARMLHIEDSLIEHGKIIDTKKVYIDGMARKYREYRPEHVDLIRSKVSEVCDWMVSIFEDRDVLLRAQGNITIYYLVARSAMRTGNRNFSREALLRFRDRLTENRKRAEQDYTDASYELLEYDRLSQQGTNDAANIVERATVLADSLGIELVLEP